MEKGLGGKGKIDVQPLQGPGRDGRQGFERNDDGPDSRKLIRVTIDEDEPGETGIWWSG